MSNNNLHPIKIILLGDTGVGKSSIIKRYYEDTFNDNLTTTFVSSYLEKTIKIKGQKVKLEIWDTAGQEEFRSITKLFVKNSKVIILVYDVTNRPSFECLNYWYDYIEKEIGKEVILGLAGNKTDLVFEDGFGEEVSLEEGKEYAEKINANFSLVSAKESGKEISDLFEQCVARYLDLNISDEDSNLNIKLDSPSTDNNKKSECCIRKNKKEYKNKNGISRV